MKQQQPGNKARDRRVQRSWAVEPSISVSGNAPLIYMRFGPNFEANIPPTMAIALANALTDCLETAEHYQYNYKKETRDRT